MLLPVKLEKPLGSINKMKHKLSLAILWMRYHTCKITPMRHENLPGSKLLMLERFGRIKDLWYITPYNVVWQLDRQATIDLVTQKRTLNHGVLMGLTVRMVGHA